MKVNLPRDTQIFISEYLQKIDDSYCYYPIAKYIDLKDISHAKYLKVIVSYWIQCGILCNDKIKASKLRKYCYTNNLRKVSIYTYTKDVVIDRINIEQLDQYGIESTLDRILIFTDTDSHGYSLIRSFLCVECGINYVLIANNDFSRRINGFIEYLSRRDNQFIKTSLILVLTQSYKYKLIIKDIYFIE